MCPESERLRREELRQLSVIEVDPTHTSRSHAHPKQISSQGLAVKEYVRAGAGHHVPSPDDLRPLGTLVQTMDYLMNSVTMREDVPWHVVYGFVNNRCQSVRQDITYQQLEGPQVLHIYKLSAKFYIYAQYRLAGERRERFDPKLNSDQLQQCLSKLLRLFSDQPPAAALASTVPVGEWAEAVSYYLLTNLGSDGAMMHALTLPRQVRAESAVQTALGLNRLVCENNFVRFFRHFPRLPPLAQCAAYPYLPALQRLGLRILCNAYCVGTKTSPFPLEVLAQWLMFGGEEDAANYCTALGLKREGKNSLLQKSTPHFTSIEVPTKLILPGAAPANCRQLISNS
jgi:SAC3 domain-containing protein 1